MNAVHAPTRILLIEDNPGDVELLRLSFADAGRSTAFEVAGDGRVGLARLHAAAVVAQSPYQLIVLDLNLPNVSGFDLLRFIKRNERLRNVPTVVLTSSDRPVERARARELDADGYFVKPHSYDGYASLVGSLGHYLLPGSDG